MKFHIISIVLINLVIAIAVNGQDCGTVFKVEDQEAYRRALQQHADMTKERSLKLAKIPMRIIMVRNSRRELGVTREEVEEEIKKVNWHFSGANLSFYVCEYLEINSNKLHSWEERYEFLPEVERLTKKDIINVFIPQSITTTSGDGLCGYAYFPWGNNSLEVMTVAAACIGPDNATFSHELGHYFGLKHTHHIDYEEAAELVDGSNCETNGDDLCDTAADPNLSNDNVDYNCIYVGTERDANNMRYSPDPSNIMSYSPKKCQSLFSPQQLVRMRDFFLSHRTNIACGGDKPDVRPNLKCHDQGKLTFSNNRISLSGLEIINDGFSHAASSHIGYYLSKNTTITKSDIYLGEDYIRALDLLETSRESFSFSTEKIKPGTYYFGILIDYKNEVSESSGKDNVCLYTSPKIIVREETEKLPNLRCQNKGQLTVSNGELKLSGFKIINDGTEKSNSTYVKYYLSGNSIITKNDTYIGQDYVRSLSEGSTSTESFNISLDDISPGEYYFGAVIDVDNRVAEASESDNTCVFTSPKVIVSEKGSDCSCEGVVEQSVCEDFNSYSNDRIGPQSDCWTTWSGNEGGQEDAYIGGEPGVKYLVVKGENSNGGPVDAVMQLGNVKQGTKILSFDTYLYYGDKGYYNLLHEFSPGSSANVWAQEVYFDGYGRGTLKVAGEEIRFTYPTGEWFVIYQYIDFDSGTTHLNIGSEYVYSWDFAYEASSKNKGSKNLAAINFYPVSDDYLMFIDNIYMYQGYETFAQSNGNDVISDSGRTKVKPVATPSAAETSVQIADELSFELYPNPTGGIVNVAFSGKENLTEGVIEVIGLNKKVIQRQHVPAVNSFTTRLDLSAYPNGVYLVRLTSKKFSKTEKIVLLGN